MGCCKMLVLTKTHPQMNTNNASTLLYVYARDVIELMEQIKEINHHSSMIDDILKIEQSIDKIAKAQSMLRKIRETATISIAK